MKLTPDAPFVLRKWSTWLAFASTASTTALLTYSQLPGRVQSLFPDWSLLALGALAMTSAALVPIATSLQQKNIP